MALVYTHNEIPDNIEMTVPKGVFFTDAKGGYDQRHKPLAVIVLAPPALSECQEGLNLAVGRGSSKSRNH